MMKSVTRRGHKTAQKNQRQSAIVNRRASFDYSLSDKLIVGLQLTGAETKAARLNHVSLKGAYVVPKLNQRTGRNELFLINSSSPPKPIRYHFIFIPLSNIFLQMKGTLSKFLA